MQQLTDKEQKQINLELLCHFDKICRENNINYSLTGGTLLGAVRHQGFIPWDDDVDVFLTRPEFEKLDNVFAVNDEYAWISPTNSDEHELPYGRLFDKKTIIKGAVTPANEGKGLFLDVCVVDGLPDNKIKQKIHIKKVSFCARARRAVVFIDKNRAEYKEKGPFFTLIKRIICLTTNKTFWMKRIEKYMKEYPFDSGEYVGNFTSQYGERERMHHSSFDSYEEMIFEGHRFMVCNGWKEYLENIYGDYMQLPPEEKRIGHHEGIIYWRKDCE